MSAVQNIAFPRWAGVRIWISCCKVRYHLEIEDTENGLQDRVDARSEVLLIPRPRFNRVLLSATSTRRRTILYARRRRLVIHLAPISLGRNLTNENPIERFDTINLACSR